MKGPWVSTYKWAADGIAQNPEVPMWTRIYHYALANMATDGHVNLLPGELARAMYKVTDDGEVKPADSSHVRREIAKAARYGFLMPESNTRCLVVNPELNSFGKNKSFTQKTHPCRWHK